MYHRIKHKIKQSKFIQYTLFLILVLIILMLPYPGEPELKQWEVNEVRSLKECIAVAGLPPTTEECAEKLDAPLDEVKQSAERTFMYSKSDKERAWAAIVLWNHTGAKDILEQLVTNDTSVRKDFVYTLMSLREFKKAAEICEQIIEEDENDIFCLDMLGISYYTMDKNQESYDSGKKAYDMSPHYCREFNLGLYSAGTGNITYAKEAIDKVIEEHLDTVLRCWSAVRPNVEGPVNASRYNICFLNNAKTQSICRAFAWEGWRTNNLTTQEPVKVPEPIVMPEGGTRLL